MKRKLFLIALVFFSTESLCVQNLWNVTMSGENDYGSVITESNPTDPVKGYISGAWSLNTDPNDPTSSHSLRIIKTDLYGNILWSKKYNGLHFPRDIQAVIGGGYLISGIAELNFNGSNSWLLKVDNNGNKVWPEGNGVRYFPTFDEGLKGGGILNIEIAPNSDIFIAGTNHIARLNSEGQFAGAYTWEKTLVNSEGKKLTVIDMILGSDGSIYVCGDVDGSGRIHAGSPGQYGFGEDFFIAKIDPMSGNILKSFYGASSNQALGIGAAVGLAEIPGGYAILAEVKDKVILMTIDNNFNYSRITQVASDKLALNRLIFNKNTNELFCCTSLNASKTFNLRGYSTTLVNTKNINYTTNTGYGYC